MPSAPQKKEIFKFQKKKKQKKKKDFSLFVGFFVVLFVCPLVPTSFRLTFLFLFPNPVSVLLFNQSNHLI